MRKALRIASDTHSMDDVIGCLQRGEMQAFYNDRGVILTSLVQSPQRKYLEIFMSAGDMDAVLSLFDEVEEWALAQGAEFGRAMVRPGFERIFKERGWKKKTVVMEYYPNKGK
jgi:hypothetical protein